MIDRSLLHRQKCIGVAELFCRPGKPVRLCDIDRDKGWPNGTASKLLKDAREMGLLEARQSLPMPRDKELGRELSRRFAPCEFVAVETHHPVLGRGPSPRGPEARDDLLHRRLGLVAAQYLAKHLRKLDHVGIGAGRPLLHMARELQHHAEARDRRGELRITSLHGHHLNRFWRDSNLHPRDATDAIRVANQLASAISSSIELAIHEPLIQESLEAARAHLSGAAHSISRHEWRSHPPQMVFVGMGVMDAKRARKDLTDLERRWISYRRTRTRPIALELRRLRQICTEFESRNGYYPVSDVCDRLFWVPEICETTIKLQNEAQRLLQRINSHILGVETGLPRETPRRGIPHGLPAFATLDQARAVVLVAGGEIKMRALGRLLDHRRDRSTGRRFMDVLIVDQKTARLLVEFRKPVPAGRRGSQGRAATAAKLVAAP